MIKLLPRRVTWFVVVMILGLPATSIAANGARLADAGRITTLAAAPRQAQIGVKFVW